MSLSAVDSASLPSPAGGAMWAPGQCELLAADPLEGRKGVKPVTASLYALFSDD